MALDQERDQPRCVPVGPDRDRCWRLLREQAGVPAKVALPAPDCERAAREVMPGEDAEPAVRVSIKVRRSLVDGAVTYLKDPPACQPGLWN
jgi:hypothetical protein